VSKQQHQSSSTSKPTADTSRLKVWAEFREEPDWEKYVAVLLAMALAEVEEERERRKRD
jgi:hypothetical protein